MAGCNFSAGFLYVLYLNIVSRLTTCGEARLFMDEVVYVWCFLGRVFIPLYVTGIINEVDSIV
jgi:hypothetical protein